MKFRIAIALSVFLGVSGAHAGEYSCGCVTPTVKVKANAGVGNGAEVDDTTAGATTEAGDLDPGNSGSHNKAHLNIDRTQSPNRYDINRLP